jgi:hypothetical protein
LGVELDFNQFDHPKQIVSFGEAASKYWVLVAAIIRGIDVSR